MIRVKNGKAIANLSRRSLRANRLRNLIAVVAIVLTTVLFTTLFTIAGTIVSSYQQETFRQVGGDFHGSFKDLSLEEFSELKDDPRIVKGGGRLMLGMPSAPPFNKAHVEVSYMDEICAKSSFCQPVQGALPAEGTREIACDTRILKLLGVEPKIGAEVALPYELGISGARTTPVRDTFTLSGWWPYDPAGMASQAVVSRSYAEDVLSGYVRRGSDQTGLWTLNVFFKSSAHIEEDFRAVLADHGYQCDKPGEDNYIDIGVNWAYLGAQLSGTADLGTLAAMAGLLLLIVLTGYLIIYNIFQISVTNDIRFYGLLKTIGATPRQIRRMVRSQALTLSALGIPIGLVLGYGVGNVLTPFIMSNLSYKTAHATLNPLIFLGAAAFSLGTVLLSCRKPGNIAGRVSPVEAVRYTEVSGGKKAQKAGASGGKIWRMALANLGRSKKKTLLVVFSLSLAVVLLQVTYTFASGFDMDKYLRQWVVTDFILGDANYFQTGGGFSTDTALDEASIAAVEAQGGITGGGRVYGKTSAIQEFVSEDWFRTMHGQWLSQEALDQWLATMERTAEGLIADAAQLYGMEPYALDQLRVLEGDLAALNDPTQNAIAAVYMTDDYAELHEDSHWAKLGDQVTLRYAEGMEYYDTRSGEAVDPMLIEEGFVGERTVNYRDVTYTVTALVVVPNSMSYRYFGEDEFILGHRQFIRDSGTSSIMTYFYDTTEDSNAAMEAYLKDYTENIDPLLDYESKQSYVANFESFRGMFLLLGGALSFIIALVGVLNFLNAVLSSILARRREFAVLQSVGMTGRQLKTMLVCEGLFYALLSIALSLLLGLAGGPAVGRVLGELFWFFTYRFTLLPVLAVAPVFLLLGAALPLLIDRLLSRQTFVERLRQAE